MVAKISKKKIVGQAALQVILISITRNSTTYTIGKLVGDHLSKELNSPTKFVINAVYVYNT